MAEEQKGSPSETSAEDRENIVLSLEKGTPADQETTAELKEILETKFELGEDPTSEALLREVLAKLRTIIKDWVKQTAIKKKQSPEVVENAGGEIYISGSFRLGVHGKTSDIDALCVAPRFVDREKDFFVDLFDILKKNKDIKDLQGIKEAHVPIIKMKFLNVDIDLLFARLSFETIGENLNLHDDNVLRGCDDEAISSLNACRNNDLIIELVPNKEAFKTVLKTVKVWAKTRDLYSNKIGYLGGIAWAILTAKTCQLYPNLPPNKLLEKLFFTFYRWNWKIPVMLCELREPKGFNLPTTHRNWNPKAAEQGELMSIITPAYPSINSTFNVSSTTRRILVKELFRAAKITRKINARTPGYLWMSLFKRYDFFKEHFHYLRVDILSQSAEEHLQWEGLVESKLRTLINYIEKMGKGVELLHPYTKPFQLADHDFKYCTTFLIGFKLTPGESGKTEADLREPLCSFCKHLTWNNYYSEKERNLRITHVTRDKLPNDVFENGVRPRYTRERKDSFDDEVPRKKGKYE